MISITHNFGESSYKRSKELHISLDEKEGIWCDCCKICVKHPVISADVSNGEYDEISICNTCMFKLINQFSEKYFNKEKTN